MKMVYLCLLYKYVLFYYLKSLGFFPTVLFLERFDGFYTQKCFGCCSHIFFMLKKGA